jgi:hypothetical protein
MPYFSCGRKWSYMNAYTVKPCDVLNAQNAVVKLVRRVTEYSKYGLVCAPCHGVQQVRACFVRRVTDYSKYGLVVLCVASCVRRVNVWDHLYLQVRDLCTFRIGKLLVAQPVLYYCCHKSQLYPVELLHMQGPPYVWQLHNSLQHFNSVQVCTLTPTFRRRMLVLHVSVLAVSLWIYIYCPYFIWPISCVTSCRTCGPSAHRTTLMLPISHLQDALNIEPIQDFIHQLMA